MAASPHRARVLQVVISLRPGGTERLVVELARRSRSDIDTAVCCLDETGEWGEALRTDGIPVTALGRQPGFRPSVGLGIARLAAAHRADAVHCHQYSPFVYGCVSKVRYAGARLIFTEHGRLADAPPSAKRRAANRVLARMPDRVFAVSGDLKAHLVSEGFDPRQVDVVPNGIEPGPLPSREDRDRVRHALGIDPATFVIGTVARLDPVKDLGTLVGAVARTAAHGASSLLLVVGDGPERDGLERAAADAGCAGRIRFAGHREDARDLLAGCDAYANSSTFEGVSLTILEAMAAALPVVATAVGGTPEIVSEQTGILVPPGQTDALAAAIEALARDAARRQTLGRAGRAAVLEHFTLDRMVADYVRVYRGEA